MTQEDDIKLVRQGHLGGKLPARGIQCGNDEIGRVGVFRPLPFGHGLGQCQHIVEAVFGQRRQQGTRDFAWTVSDFQDVKAAVHRPVTGQMGEELLDRLSHAGIGGVVLIKHFRNGRTAQRIEKGRPLGRVEQ